MSPNRGETALPRRWTVGKLAATVVLIATFGFWVWAFSPWARRDNPDRLTDRQFAASAEEICASTGVRIAALPSARTAHTPQERAAQVETGTLEVQAMVDDLRELVPTVQSVRERETLAKWLADWDQYLDDRWAHVERLQAADDDTPDRDLAFVVSSVGRGGSYTERLDGFARVNDMQSCLVPGDV